MSLGPKFISIEGGEGAGKSTFISEFSKRLTKENQSFITSREPGGTPIGEAVRPLFNHPPEGESWTPLSELLMVSSLRVQHITHKIKPALARGQWVLCDRFFDSTTVYQGYVGGLDLPLIQSINNMVAGQCTPDLTVLLDLDPETAKERLKNRQESTLSRYDKRDIDFYEKIRAAFLDLAQENEDRFLVLNTKKTPEELVNLTWDHLTKS